jgi:hypothetical protein
MTMIGETLLADGWLPFAMAEMIYARGPPDPRRTDRNGVRGTICRRLLSAEQS